MQDVVLIAVNAAVSIEMVNCITVFQKSLFFIFFIIFLLVLSLLFFSFVLTPLHIGPFYYRPLLIVNRHNLCSVKKIEKVFRMKTQTV